MCRWTLLGLVVALLVAPASANTITLKFSGTDGVSTGLFWGGGNSNLGAQPGGVILSRPGDDWYFPIALFRFDLPADMVGATINSATFTLKETMWNGYTYNGVEARRVDSPVAWVPGAGLQVDRWAADSGAGRYFANYDKVAWSGTGWDGATHDGDWTGSPFNTTAMADLIDTEDGVGNGGLSTWNLQAWLQNVAAGTWDNDGFAISMFNTSRQDGLTGGTLELKSNLASTGLTIDYTPAPEPATMALLAVGGVACLRRRRK